MHKKNHTQLTISENFLYHNLPDDILANIDRLVNWEPFAGKGDPEASFTKKGNQIVYSYKDHLAIDPKYEFVTEFVCTPANVHDSQVIDELLSGDETFVFADKAYDSKTLKRRKRNVVAV